MMETSKESQVTILESRVTNLDFEPEIVAYCCEH